MGQAKAKRESGAKIAHCGDCTLCCDLLQFDGLDKPPYHRCRHVTETGCGVFGARERPAACASYRCTYVRWREERFEVPAPVPPPWECGAFCHSQTDARGHFFVITIDPSRPLLWKRSPLPAFVRPYMIQRGYQALVVDRGRTYTLTTARAFDEFLSLDFDALAPAGHPHDIEGWTTRDI